MLKYLGTECYDAYNELSNDSGKLSALPNTERRGLCRKTLATGFPARGKDSMSSPTVCRFEHLHHQQWGWGDNSLSDL